MMKFEAWKIRAGCAFCPKIASSRTVEAVMAIVSSTGRAFEIMRAGSPLRKQRDPGWIGLTSMLTLVLPPYGETR